MTVFICLLLSNLVWLFLHINMKKDIAHYKMVEGAKLKFLQLVNKEMKEKMEELERERTKTNKSRKS